MKVPFRQHRHGNWRQKMVPSMVARLSRRLKLDERQQAAIRPEVEKAVAELCGPRDEVFLRIRTILEPALDDLEPHLTPERNSKLRERARRRWGRFAPVRETGADGSLWSTCLDLVKTSRKNKFLYDKCHGTC